MRHLPMFILTPSSANILQTSTIGLKKMVSKSSFFTSFDLINAATKILSSFDKYFGGKVGNE